jgi:hypothetical protein
VTVQRNRLRPRYKHGSGDYCGRKPGFCSQKINIRRRLLDGEGVRVRPAHRRAA